MRCGKAELLGNNMKITNETMYENTLKRILVLMTKKKTEKETQEYLFLVGLVKAYETEELGEDVINQADLDHFNKIQAA